jgi:hypothetical protein
VDDLDRSITRRTIRNYSYPEMLRAEIRRQRLIVKWRANRLTQTQVTAEMNASGSVVVVTESSGADIRSDH